MGLAHMFLFLYKHNPMCSIHKGFTLFFLQKDVGACKDAPDEVKKGIWKIVVGLQQKLN